MKQVTIIIRLAKNDFKAKYAASLLGIIWAFVQPMITILVFWFVFQMGFKSKPVDDVPFILWFVVAYIPWIYFNDMLNFGVNVLSDYSYLVKKMKFKVEYLPIVRILSSLFVHIFFIFFIFVMFFYYKYPISIYCIQALYYTFALTMLSWGIIMLFSSWSVFFRDISQIVMIILQIGFWATPIFWNIEEVNSVVAGILKLNPMYYIVTGYRDSFIDKIPFWYHCNETIYYWIITVLVCLAGWISFKRLRKHFADEL